VIKKVIKSFIQPAPARVLNSTLLSVFRYISDLQPLVFTCLCPGEKVGEFLGALQEAQSIKLFPCHLSQFNERMANLRNYLN
jgi:hypothetical protein